MNYSDFALLNLVYWLLNKYMLKVDTLGSL